MLDLRVGTLAAIDKPSLLREDHRQHCQPGWFEFEARHLQNVRLSDEPTVDVWRSENCLDTDRTWDVPSR
jgi:hypothetical protein